MKECKKLLLGNPDIRHYDITKVFLFFPMMFKSFGTDFLFILPNYPQFVHSFPILPNHSKLSATLALRKLFSWSSLYPG